MATSVVGESIPAHTPHAVSVSLPTWRANVGYEEGEDWVVSRMTTGYPRFFIHKMIIALAEDIVQQYGHDGDYAMLFPSGRTARRCVSFITTKEPTVPVTQIRVVDLVLDPTKVASQVLRKASPSISAVIFPFGLFSVAKQYWQHSGDGVSSRRAEFCHGLFQDGLLVEVSASASAIVDSQHPRACKGPKRYQRGSSIDKTPATLHGGDGPRKSENAARPNGTSETKESSQFVEERYGRNLDLSFLENAKSAIRRRITGSLTTEVDLTTPLGPETDAKRGVTGLSEEDVLLFPCGMNAIFNAHQMMLEARGSLKSISYGFPYVDTLKILEKFGPGCIFYGNGSSDDLDDLEVRLKGGERYLALFCEFPGNPLLKSPDLQRIRSLADTYDFGVIVDETIGNFINVHVLPCADIVVSSLTKVFTGECNVMGGCAVLNPMGRYYRKLKAIVQRTYEENYWAEDILFMERNSRDFVSRIERINNNAEAICDVLQAHPTVKAIFYPKYVESRRHYDACRTPNGGYGGLLSVTFHTKAQAVAFFDRIETAKGPSLGTNFTLTSPYVVLAHYMELDWARSFGVDPDLIRVSVGLEQTEVLKSIFGEALKAAEDCVGTA